MSPDVLTLIQWSGCASGVLGACLLALHNRYSGFGFVLFLISNLFWITFAITTHTPGLLTQQAFFTLTSLLGIWNWLVRRPHPAK